MTKTVVGLYDTLDNAQEAVEDLIDSGFPKDNISLVVRDTTGATEEYGVTEEDPVTTGEAAGAGAGIGAVVGGLAGLLIGAGVLILPGLGAIVALGPLVGMLTGAGAGAIAGGLIGALIELGVPEEEAEYYAEGVRRGGALVTVQTQDANAQRAVDIMDRHNLVDIDRRVEHWADRGWEGYDRNAEPYTVAEIERERALYR